MPIKKGREYRSFGMAEFSAVPNDEEHSYIVEGYATTFDVPYDFGCGGWKECIDSRALEGCDMSDVIFQFNHSGMVMARQKNGTLELTPDAHGIHVRADLSGTQAGRELHEAIRNGLVDKMSWGFLVAKDGYEDDFENRVSTIRKIEKIYDVSAVDIPADMDTEIQARSHLAGLVEAEKREAQALADREERERMALLLEATTTKGF